jgi:CubicO group peptidase (beta-lactamase class C family)
VNPGAAEPEQAAPNIWDTTPENQAATFRNQDQTWPVRVIRRGDAVRPLPPHARSLADLTFEVGGVRLSPGDYMARRRTAGLLILKRGEIALERYGMGNGPESRWTSFSTAKSMTATLAGAALHDGAIGSLDDPCDRYVPRLRARPMRASRSAMSCGCARAWPGARRTIPTDAPRSIACSGPSGYGGPAASWI